MRPRALFFLSLAAVALGAFIYFYERDLPSTDERIQQAKKVLRIASDAVATVLIEWGDQTVRLERNRPRAGASGDPATALDGWRIASPIDARADGGEVDSLVSSLTDLESSRAFEGFDRGELGLDDPRARVTLITDSGQTVLEVGAELPASSDMVVAVAGGAKAYRVASSLIDQLTKAAGDWREKKLFPGLRSDVERLSWTASGGAEVLLAKRGDDFWIESPLTDRADEELANTLLSELVGLRAEAFVDDSVLTPDSLGLEPPQAVLEVVLAGRERPFRLELGKASADEGVVYARVEQQRVEIKTRLFEPLATSAADWRSKAWTALQVFKIETARFEDAAGVLEVRRDGADWQRGTDRVGYTVVSDLLYAITEARGQQVLERAAAIAAGRDLDSPALAITLSAKDADQELAAEDLSLWPSVGGFAAATAGGRDVVLLLAEKEAAEIRDKLQALRVAEPLPVPDAVVPEAAGQAAGGEDDPEPGE